MTALANFWDALQPLLPIIGVGVLIAIAARTVVTVRDINRAAEQRRAQRDAQAFVAQFDAWVADALLLANQPAACDRTLADIRALPEVTA